METKTCTTCKFEPEWSESWGETRDIHGVLISKGTVERHGNCKRIPALFSANDLIYYKESNLIYVDHKTTEDEIILTDCLLWEAKE